MVDLRSQHNETYSQGPDNACGPFAACAALDCMYERTLDKPIRFDPYYLWNWVRFHSGMGGTNTGSTFETLEKATRLNGVKADEVITGLRLIRTRVSDKSYAELKHLLSMGIPVIWLMKVTPDVYALGDKRDWRKHDISADTSTTHGMHFVCIVGYDDKAGRWLVENSWGSEWADGGFFGVPYASFQSLTEGLMHFNELPINPKKTEGYTVPAFMLTADKAAFTDRSKDALLKHLMDAFSNSVQSLIDECVKWGVSDKHLETMAGWERGAVRGFLADNPGFRWDGFVWDQL